MRPPLVPGVAYTVMSDAAVRRQLAFEHGLNRARTADMTLDQLHDELSERLPPELGALLVVVTDKAFTRLARQMDELLARYHARPIDPTAPIMSRTRALEVLREAGVEDMPDDPPLQDLEDAVTGLRADVVHVIADDDFAAYGEEARLLLSSVPSGRPRAAS